MSISDTDRSAASRSSVKEKGAMGFPGAETAHKRIAEIVRVDHAGEYGAVRIYEGQLAVLGKSRATARTAAMVRHMAEQEEGHLAGFNEEIIKRGLRPTALLPFWHVAGYALGAATALMGEKAAMACTEAVEDVIVEHYTAQEKELEGREPDLRAKIAQYRAEELEHHDTAVDEGARETFGYGLLSAAIKTGCRMAIKVAEKV